MKLLANQEPIDNEAVSQAGANRPAMKLLAYQEPKLCCEAQCS